MENGEFGKSNAQSPEVFVDFAPPKLASKHFAVTFSCQITNERLNIMSKFENVSIVKKANVYFDGNVTSRTVEFSDGSTKTLGIMLPGDYNFSTGKPELMEITSGSCKYRLSGSDEWQTVNAGEAFNVPGDSSFDIVADEVLDYCCSFIG